MDKNTAPTHTAFTRKRDNGRITGWIEVGTVRHDADNKIHIYLYSTPLGGFDGRVQALPIGSKAPDLQPERPASPESEDE